MIVVRLWGGIGNQLFQYSFGEYLRIEKKMDVIYDVSSFENSDKLRKLELSIIDNEIPLIKNILFPKHTGIVNRILRFLFSLNNNFMLENSFSLENTGKYANNNRYYLQGYWQNTIYTNYVKNIDDFFIPKQEAPNEIEILKNRITSTDNSVALHIRRGDYFSKRNIDIYGVCNIEYYIKALNILRDKSPDNTIYIFSDDLVWVKNNLELSKDDFLIPNYDVNQFWYIYLMSCCKHNIISNSSFSWWGAYLNKHSDKIVISPRRWTLDSDHSLALADWIKI